MRKLKSLVRFERKHSHILFFDTAWGESQVFHAGFRIHRDDQSPHFPHSIFQLQTSKTTCIGPMAKVAHCKRKTSSCFHMCSSILCEAIQINTKREPRRGVAHFRIGCLRHRGAQLVPLYRLLVGPRETEGATSFVTLIRWF